MYQHQKACHYSDVEGVQSVAWARWTNGTWKWPKTWSFLDLNSGAALKLRRNRLLLAAVEEVVASIPLIRSLFRVEVASVVEDRVSAKRLFTSRRTLHVCSGM